LKFFNPDRLRDDEQDAEPDIGLAALRGRMRDWLR
jgi:hypothetical protein